MYQPSPGRVISSVSKVTPEKDVQQCICSRNTVARAVATCYPLAQQGDPVKCFSL